MKHKHQQIKIKQIQYQENIIFHLKQSNLLHFIHIHLLRSPPSNQESNLNLTINQLAMIIESSSHITQSQKMIQTQYESQKKLKNLFYIKSKHTKKNFKNHPYFRTTTDINQTQEKSLQKSLQPNHKMRPSLINEKRLKTESCHQPQNIVKPSPQQFVSYPTQFGLENTYNYLREKSFIAKFQSESSLNSQRNKQKQTNKNNKSSQFRRKIQTQANDDSQSQKNYMKITASYESKFYNTTKTEQNQQIRQFSDCDQKIQNRLFDSKFGKKKPLAIFKLMSKRNSISISNQPQLAQSQISQNISNVNRNIIYNTQILKNNPIQAVFHTSSQPAQHNLQFIYAKRLKSCAQIPYRTILFDLFPYIITTFLKCKINYSQMNQFQYDFVHQGIIKVLNANKKHQKYQIKDIINIGSIKQIMHFLKQFKGEQKDFEWVQTLRYFFLLKDQKVLEYHLNKIKEDIAQLIAIKFDVQFGQKELFVYDLDKRTQVLNVYDLLKGERFLISDQSRVLSEYLALQNQQYQNQTLQTKINKWKSLANSSPAISENGDLQASKISRNPSKSVKDPLRPILIPCKKLSEQKFKDIFEQFKIRQKKRLSKHYVGGSRSVSHSLQSSFIEKSKLKKQQDFFE